MSIRLNLIQVVGLVKLVRRYPADFEYSDCKREILDAYKKLLDKNVEYIYFDLNHHKDFLEEFHYGKLWLALIESQKTNSLTKKKKGIIRNKRININQLRGSLV